MVTPKVSVIIPNYNHAKYLDQRIQSVLNQTYQDFEVIILDDCSPDNGASRTAIEKYRYNPHVSHIVYNEKNSGSTFIQWQKGFSLAKGEIIWIAESDDWCELNFLEVVVPCFDDYSNVVVAQSSGYFAHRDKKSMLDNMGEPDTLQCYDGIEYIKKFLVKSNYYIPNASGVLFRKDVAMSLSKDYMQYKASGDRLFWIYMLEHGSICQVNKPLNYFRQHDNKVSPQKELNGTQACENYRINRYLHKQGYIDFGLSAEEFVFYYNYFHQHPFASEKVRNKVLRLWFPWWKRNPIYHRLMKGILKIINSKI